MRKRRINRRARKKKLPTEMPAIAPLLRVEGEEGGEVDCDATEEDVVEEVMELLAVVDVVVLVGSAVDRGGEAVEPAVMRFRYESVMTVSVAPQYMIYWSSRTLIMVTQAGAADGLGHNCRVNLCLCGFRAHIRLTTRSMCWSWNEWEDSDVPIDTAASVWIARRGAGRAVGQTCCSRCAARATPHDDAVSLQLQACRRKDGHRTTSNEPIHASVACSCWTRN